VLYFNLQAFSFLNNTIKHMNILLYTQVNSIVTHYIQNTLVINHYTILFARDFLSVWIFIKLYQ